MMRLISWNIQWGRGHDGRVDLPRIVAHARQMADVDVLCLQEVADNFADLAGLAGEDQFAEIAALLPGYHAVPGVALDIPGEAGGRRRFGNMMLSRYPVGPVLRHLLPWEAENGPNMPRLLLEATLMTPAGPLRVMTTHLEYSSARLRASQVEGIRQAHAQGSARAGLKHAERGGTYRMHPATASALLCGDFNMNPDEPAKARLAEPFESGAPRLVDAWTALHPGEPHPPSFCIADQTYGPPHCCDFVFATQDLAPRLRRIAYDTETRLSDHQPVLVAVDV